MAEEPLSEDEIIAKERRNYRSVMRATMTLFVIALILDVAVRISDPAAISRVAGSNLIFVMPLTFVLLGGFMLLRRPPEQAHDERIIRKQIDDHQARWRVSYLILLVLLLDHAVRLTWEPDLTISHWSIYVYVAMVLIFALVVCLGHGRRDSAYRRATNDELTIAMRRKSVTIGYLCLMIMLCAFYIAISYNPAVALPLLPPLLFTAVSIPTLYFVFLQWRAGRSG